MHHLSHLQSYQVKHFILLYRSGKLILGATVVATGTVLGGMYYANNNPAFRKNVEKNIPFSAAVFNSVLGKDSPGAQATGKTPSIKPVSH